MAMTLADVIAKRLGGKRNLRKIIKATEFDTEDDGETLIFKFQMALEVHKAKANQIRITHNSLDRYDVVFRKFTTIPRSIEVVSEFNNVHPGNLVDVFEDFTGIQLYIPGRDD